MARLEIGSGRAAGLCLVLYLGLCLAATVQAEHEADHRYAVQGYVLDTQENPRANVKVVVIANEGVLGQDLTDHRGFYDIALHLHNADLGKQLTVRAGKRETEIEVTFDPQDRTTVRVHRLSFVGKDTTEAGLGFRGMPTWWYIAAGVILVLIIARIAANEVKKHRRRLERHQQKKNKTAKKKTRKKTGKKTRQAGAKTAKKKTKKAATGRKKKGGRKAQRKQGPS